MKATRNSPKAPASKKRKPVTNALGEKLLESARQALVAATTGLRGNEHSPRRNPLRREIR